MIDGLRRRLRGLLGGAQGAAAAAPGAPVERGDQVLVTARLADPSPILGVREVYFCPPCGDYFVLAWRPKAERRAPGERPVTADALPGGRAGLERAPIFCPACGARYPEYGLVDGVGGAVGPITLREHRRVRAPRGEGGGPAGARPPRFRGFATERIVVLVAGEWPEGLGKDEFVLSFLSSILGPELQAAAGAPLAIDLCVVDRVDDDTAALVPFLQEHLYPGASWGDRACLSHGPLRLRPPLGEILLCLVAPGP